MYIPGEGLMMFSRNVAEGIHRLSHAYVNVYIVEGEDGITIVDSGLPSMWAMLAKSVVSLGYGRGDIKAIALTHAHFDHIGLAARAQRELGVPVLGHRDDAYIAAHPYRYKHEKPRMLYPFAHPDCIPVIASMAKAGALWVKGVKDLSLYGAETELNIPGRPRLIHTPGHTYGHCALHFPDRDTIISGDALVTLDPYTAWSGPHLVAGAATADSQMALRSLDAMAATGASTVLPGHGEPWTGGISKAVEAAKRNGPS